VSNQVYRPDSFESFHGQSDAKEMLRIAVVSAKRRKAAVPHTLLSGPPGLGKTTLAKILAAERGTELSELNAVAIDKPADLVAPLLQVPDNGFLFIDEIHALKSECEECLYTAMEDRKITIPVGDGKEPVVTTVAAFTLVGATTRDGLLSRPMLERFQVREKLQAYTDEEMEVIVNWTMDQFEQEGDVVFNRDMAPRLVKFCHGVARNVQRFLVAIRDHAMAFDDSEVPHAQVLHLDATVKRMGYDENGLSRTEQRYLAVLASCNGRSVGLKHLSKMLDEDERTIEDVIEPWLLQQEYIIRTASGRVLRKDHAS